MRTTDDFHYAALQMDQSQLNKVGMGARKSSLLLLNINLHFCSASKVAHHNSPHLSLPCLRIENPHIRTNHRANSLKYFTN